MGSRILQLFLPRPSYDSCILVFYHANNVWDTPVQTGGCRYYWEALPPWPHLSCPIMYRSICSSTLVEASLRTAWIKQGDTVGVEKVFPIRATENFLQKISLGTYSNLVNLPGSRSYHAEISLNLDQFKINMTGWIWILIKGNGSSITGIEKNII